MKLLINKCFICIGFLSLLFVLSYSLVINSNNECGKKIEIDCKEYTNKNQFVKSAMDTKVIEDEPEIEEKLKKGCVVVNVKTMCDSSYQNAHKKDWKVRAKKSLKKPQVNYTQILIYLLSLRRRYLVLPKNPIMQIQFIKTLLKNIR